MLRDAPGLSGDRYSPEILSKSLKGFLSASMGQLRRRRRRRRWSDRLSFLFCFDVWPLPLQALRALQQQKGHQRLLLLLLLLLNPIAFDIVSFFLFFGGVAGRPVDVADCNRSHRRCRPIANDPSESSFITGKSLHRSLNYSFRGEGGRGKLYFLFGFCGCLPSGQLFACLFVCLFLFGLPLWFRLIESSPSVRSVPHRIVVCGCSDRSSCSIPSISFSKKVVSTIGSIGDFDFFWSAFVCLCCVAIFFGSIMIGPVYSI